MATTKPTRSPQSAQLYPSPRHRRRQRDTPARRGLPPQPYAEKPIVYETLHAFNRDIEQVLIHLDKLHEMRIFRPDVSNIFRIMIQETRCFANLDVHEVMQQVEQDDWAIFGRLHRQWEKKYEDPNDILLQAKQLKA